MTTLRNSPRYLPLLLSLCATACQPSGERERMGSHEVADDGHGDEQSDHGHEGEHGHSEHGEPGVVTIAPDAIERSGIRIAKVGALPAAGGVRVPAEVQAEPNRVAHISSVVSGQLSRVTASVGDHVEAGQTLGVIRSVALGEARAQASRSQANVEVARANLLRQEELRKEGIGAERTYLEAQADLRRAEAEQSAAERALEVYGRGGRGSEVPIKSPIAGRVVARHATVGEVVSPGDELFQVTDISEVWAVGRVYQRDAGRVVEGASAVLTLQSHPDRTFAGTLDYVAPALDERTRTLPVRMVLQNPDGVLRPGSFGSLSIAADGEARADVPAVALAAIQRLGARTVVFVPGEVAGQFRAVPVRPASRVGVLVPVSGGLAPGDAYVAEGAFVLKSELSRGELGEGHAH